MNGRPSDSTPAYAAGKRRVPAGAAPGTLIADPEALPPNIAVITYGPQEFSEHTNQTVEAIAPMIGQMPVTWVNVNGLGDVDVIGRLGELFDIHGLALEDVINTHQRPKVEEYEDHLFIVIRMSPPWGELRTEQLSVFLGDNYVLTFQERPGDGFERIRERIRNGRGKVRQAGADYLTYALLDSVVDGFFPVLEAYDEQLEALEDRALGGPTSDLMEDIHQAKRELITLRRSLLPQQELFHSLVRDEIPLVTAQTRFYLRDCYDHIIRLTEILESHRETASSLLDLYHSSLSTRMNESMKVLTIIATVFIPLSFVAGVYGMNFEQSVSPWNMPELSWKYGYIYALGLMATIAGALVIFFRLKGWIGPPLRRTKENDE
jgi:magnesium transporter